MSHKIGWCDETWNPVWGCPNNCRYCYARKIAKRFAKIIGLKEFHYLRAQTNCGHAYGLQEPEFLINELAEFKPTWLESQFIKKFPKKPSRIFVGSMSEIGHWKSSWIKMVLDKIEEYPQHTFQFLTKNPMGYNQFNFSDNFWLGSTITEESDFLKYDDYWGPNIFFASIEPIHGPISDDIIAHFDWIILGLETGNQKGKIIPKFKWIDDIYQACGKNNIPIYMKDNLNHAFPDLVLRKQFPGDTKC